LDINGERYAGQLAAAEASARDVSRLNLVMPQTRCRLGRGFWYAGARYALALGLVPGGALADTLSSQSSVGLQAGYNSNPFLETSGAHAAESLAVLADLPATYTSDTQSIDLVARLRYGETHGDIALLSNYENLDADWRLNKERNTVTAGAQWHHDSTFYNPFENAALFGRSLRRLEDLANLDWKHDLSERSDLHLTGSWDKVTYSQSVESGVQNYSYYQGLMQYDHVQSERWQWTVAGGFGRYELLNGGYAADNRFVQTSLKRLLSEHWSMTAQVGYAHLSSSDQGYTCCEIVLGPTGYTLRSVLLTQSASRGSGDYALTIEHKGERLVVDLAECARCGRPVRRARADVPPLARAGE
jgi:hypothetical protein